MPETQRKLSDLENSNSNLVEEVLARPVPGDDTDHQPSDEPRQEDQSVYASSIDGEELDDWL